MSAKAAIQLAIATELACQGKPAIGLRATLGGAELADPPELENNPSVERLRDLRNFAIRLKNGEGGAGIAQIDIPNFLARVAILLRADDPSLRFNWAKIDPAQVVNLQLWSLIDRIAQETEPYDRKTS